jgi:hypothetical protein
MGISAKDKHRDAMAGHLAREEGENLDWVDGFLALAGADVAVVAPPLRAGCAGLKPGATGHTVSRKA